MYPWRLGPYNQKASLGRQEKAMLPCPYTLQWFGYLSWHVVSSLCMQQSKGKPLMEQMWHLEWPLKRPQTGQTQYMGEAFLGLLNPSHAFLLQTVTAATNVITMEKECTMILTLTPSAGFLETQAVIDFWICIQKLWVHCGEQKLCLLPQMSASWGVG